MNRSVFVVLALVILFGGLPFFQTVYAQYLPLLLDQSIPLPSTSGIWDAMPHPDGYYLWVQAIQPIARQTRVYWGRTDIGNRDSIDLAVGSPQAITCFWRENHEPFIVLESRFIWDMFGVPCDSSYFRIYRLQNGQPDSMFWYWRGLSTMMWPEGSSYSFSGDFYWLTVVLNPPPPYISSHVLAPIAYRTANWGRNYPGGVYSYRCGSIISVLGESNNIILPLNSLGHFASWCTYRDSVLLVYTGDILDNSRSEYNSNLLVLRTQTDTTCIRDTLLNCHSHTSNNCTSYRIAATYDSISRILHSFTRTSEGYQMFSSPSVIASWTVPGPYKHWLAAECISGNSTEEFLAYDSTRHVFDVFNAVDGHYYGITDTITFAASEVKTIGRYDSTSRRLAARNGNHLNLYRFGVYLGADDPGFILHPSSFSLSSFPNPFNPSTTISFSLPRACEVKLSVFDVMGRRGSGYEGEHIGSPLQAGEHEITFDGSGLPSGIYFARLEAESVVKIQKMVLLK